MSTAISGQPGNSYSPRSKRVVGLAKQQNESYISAQDDDNYNHDKDQEILKLNEDIEKLKSILMKAKSERETLLNTVSHLEHQSKVHENVVSEV